MIEARYTLTYDDYREANGLPPVEPADARWARWKPLAWVLAVGVVAVGFFFLNEAERRQRTGGREPFPFTRLLLTMSPSLVLCLLFTFILFRVARNPAQKPWLAPPPEAQKKVPKPNSFSRFVMGWVLFVLIAFILFMMMHDRPTATGAPGVTPLTRLPLTFDFALPLIPLFLLLVAIGFSVGLTSKRQLPKTWESMQHEQQPRTLRADAEALIVEQETALLRYAWAHFAGYKETKNLLIVYLSPYSFHMVPKRAFATPADLDAFKGLLMNGIAEGTFLPSEQKAAFPVVPMAKVAAADTGPQP